MKWETPESNDIRFGFEVTMYINNKAHRLKVNRGKRDRNGPFSLFISLPFCSSSCCGILQFSPLPYFQCRRFCRRRFCRNPGKR